MQCSVEPKVIAEVMYTPVFRRGKGQIYPISKLGNFPGSKNSQVKKQHHTSLLFLYYMQ